MPRSSWSKQREFSAAVCESMCFFFVLAFICIIFCLFDFCLFFFLREKDHDVRKGVGKDLRGVRRGKTGSNNST